MPKVLDFEHGEINHMYYFANHNGLKMSVISPSVRTLKTVYADGDGLYRCRNLLKNHISTELEH